MKKILPALLFLAPALAWAHPGHGASGGFLAGLYHPLLGLDHLLAALAVGLWAAGSPRRSRWILFPAAFLFGMALGGAEGLSGLVFPYYETGILISIAVLGLALLTSPRLPLSCALGVLALFGWMHGNAHGAELTGGAQALAFGGGFLLSTAALHLLGIAAARLPTSPRWLADASRVAGASCLFFCAAVWLT